MRCTKLTLISNDADSRGLGHRLSCPVGGLARWILRDHRDHAISDSGAQRHDARGPGLVAKKTVNAFLHETLLPAPDGRLADPGGAHDLVRAGAPRGEKHDPRSQHMSLGVVPIHQDRLQEGAAGGVYVYGGACSHPVDSRSQILGGIP